MLGSGRIVLTLTFWSLIVLPALCMGGMLVHDCECTIQSECGHEADCADDPCSDLSVTSRENNDLIDMLPSTSLTLIDLDTPYRLRADKVHFLAYCICSLHGQQLPFAPSDLPLLI